MVEEKCTGSGLAEEDKAFIAEFYKYGFVGVMLDWIANGMKADYREITDRVCILMHGSIDNSIRNFEKFKR